MSPIVLRVGLVVALALLVWVAVGHGAAPDVPVTVACGLSGNAPGTQRVHVMDQRIPGPGYALTMVFVGGRPVMLYRWAGDEHATLLSATVLASLWELGDEGLAEEFVARLVRRDLEHHVPRDHYDR